MVRPVKIRDPIRPRKPPMRPTIHIHLGALFSFDIARKPRMIAATEMRKPRNGIQPSTNAARPRMNEVRLSVCFGGGPPAPVYGLCDAAYGSAAGLGFAAYGFGSFEPAAGCGA